MFSREVATDCEQHCCSGILPSRGSDHPAFVEMLFLWSEVVESDPRYRNVILPSGFVFVTVDSCRHEIRDEGGHVRAVVKTPQERNHTPSVVPVRRYSLGADIVGQQYRGVAYDRGNAVYRTKPLPSQVVAVAMAKGWLDENKPRWESYISAVNFG